MHPRITVNGVSPDMMETRFLSEIQELIIKKNAEQNPLGRNMTVKDVIPAIDYLLSDKAEAVTGQNIGITGEESKVILEMKSLTINVMR